jgi:hypothetical protein
MMRSRGQSDWLRSTKTSLGRSWLPGLFPLPLLRQRVGKILKDAKRALFQAQYIASFGQPGVITPPP